MSKTTKLFDLLLYVNTKRSFTANEIAREFDISVRTAHRYLLELEEMGVPLYTEPGRNGGYRILSSRVLPPIIFNEDEALAIFFSFQSLKYFKSLPFEVDIESVSRKLLVRLPDDVKKHVGNLESTLLFWNHKRDTDTPLLKTAIQKAAQKKIIDIKYKSKREVTSRTIAPIGVYANHGVWYMPAHDWQSREMRMFRVDRVLEISDSEKEYSHPDTTLYDILHSYEVKEPVHLYVKLSDQGMLSCKDNPYFETSICSNTDGAGGFINQTIDRSDFDYASRFFMGLGVEAEVIQPLEMRENIRRMAQDIQEQYK
ncbi:HTH domain protein [Oxobacter pfennigii]|uniref:HTH domain protein n=1 Tax=Oxobacter pfennigii TaxID=36849 RepID=A0A0P8X0Z1_9CLOT|nr:YafY family protein [Oxobacter pfennigii]KPU44457.1 HTH domain protein [Oxobacter pfennigii]